MNLRRSLLIALALAFAGPAITANAQVKTRDHRDSKAKAKAKAKPKTRDHRGKKAKAQPRTRPAIRGSVKAKTKIKLAPPSRRPARRVPVQAVPLTASGMSPTAGPVGTQVTITGTGFRRGDRVRIGRRFAQVTSITPTAISAIVPARGNGRVQILRRRRRPIVAGTFTVERPPRIVRFAPRSGSPGTQVELRGRGFRAGDQVFFGPKRALSRVQSDRIVVDIPGGVKSAKFSIKRNGRAVAFSRKTFRVLRPSPEIRGFAPEAGAPGTVIRISGNHLVGPRVRVLYGRRPAKVIERGPGFLMARVPRNARRSQVLSVSSPRGSSAAAIPFGLVLPPVATRVVPRASLVGAQMEIHGRHFQPGDQVTIANTPVEILQLRSNRISVRIPPSARTGAVRITRGALQVSAGQFSVLRPPVMNSFSPTEGPATTIVTLTGQNFGPKARVFYGKRPAQVVKRIGTSAISVRVPSAGPRKFTVRTAVGEASSTAPFHLHVYPVVMNTSPTSGPPGTRVTINGRRLLQASTWYLGTTPLKVIAESPKQVILEIPRHSKRARFQWDSQGVRQTSTRWFSPVLTPAFVSMSPLAGPPGTEVRVIGRNFPGGAILTLDGFPMKMVSGDSTTLVAKIPNGAPRSAPIFVEAYGAHLPSNQNFTVLEPIAVKGVTPKRALPGQTVTLRVTGTSPTATVRLGKRPVTIVRRTGTTLKVVVPPGAKKRRFFVEDRGMVAVSRPITVMKHALIRRANPAAARPGQVVILRGQRLRPAVKVLWGDTELPIIRRAGKRRVWVQLPADMHGTFPLTTLERGLRTLQKASLTVTAPPPPPPPRKPIVVRKPRPEKVRRPAPPRKPAVVRKPRPAKPQPPGTPPKAKKKPAPKKHTPKVVRKKRP